MVEFARFDEPGEKDAVDKIVGRALPLFREIRVRKTQLDIRMDLSAVHAKVPLRLAEFADADDFNFEHDILGIHRHLDRQTGELGDFFVPRFAAPVAVRG